MSFEPHDYLRHILVEVEYLLDQSRTLTHEQFVADQTLRRAFVRSLEIIGEGVKNLPLSSGYRIPRLRGARWLRCAIT